MKLFQKLNLISTFLLQQLSHLTLMALTNFFFSHSSTKKSDASHIEYTCTIMLDILITEYYSDWQMKINNIL